MIKGLHQLLKSQGYEIDTVIPKNNPALLEGLLRAYEFEPHAQQFIMLSGDLISDKSEQNIPQSQPYNEYVFYVKKS